MAKVNWIPYETSNGKKPVIKFLNSMSAKDRAKAIHTLELISEYGIGIGMPYIKLFKKAQIGEVRFKGRDHLYRIFFFHWDGNDFVLTHGFIKKTQKTPLAEIKRAIQFREDYFKRKGGL